MPNSSLRVRASLSKPFCEQAPTLIDASMCDAVWAILMFILQPQAVLLELQRPVLSRISRPEAQPFLHNPETTRVTWNVRQLRFNFASPFFFLRSHPSSIRSGMKTQTSERWQALAGFGASKHPRPTSRPTGPHSKISVKMRTDCWSARCTGGAA